jgi:hypothetical protein
MVSSDWNGGVEETDPEVLLDVDPGLAPDAAADVIAMSATSTVQNAEKLFQNRVGPISICDISAPSLVDQTQYYEVSENELRILLLRICRTIFWCLRFVNSD